MKYFVFGPTYIICLDPGDKIVESLGALCVRDGIGGGVFSGIGAVSGAEIGWFDPASRKYTTVGIEEPCEIVSLTGNVSLLDGKPFIHAHIALGDRTFGVRGGHLREAVVSATAEIVLTRFFDDIVRRKDDENGATFLDLKPDDR